MSAGPSPPNPGQSKSPMSRLPHQPTMLRRYAGPLLLGSLALGVTFTYFTTRSPKPPGTPTSNVLKTPGVQNIEKAYTNGGATATHTPAYGGTVMGSASSRDQDAGLRDGAASGGQMKKGFQSEGMGFDQRPEPLTPIGKKWNEMKYGSEKGK